MVRAGFDPTGAVGMQEKLAKLGAGGNSVAQKLLGTHPISRERLAAIRTEVAKYPNQGQITSPEFTRAKAEIQSRESGLTLISDARKKGAEKEFGSALSLTSRALKILPNEHSAWRLHTELLVANQQPRKAIESALRVRELNPTDPISELLLGYCYDAAGDRANGDAARDRARRLAQ
jgi:predicted Zn-dependent protease